MSRFKLTIEYDGTRYSGWQMQKGGKTIQGEILDACRELFKKEAIDIFGAGRTDAGVHAGIDCRARGLETKVHQRNAGKQRIGVDAGRVPGGTRAGVVDQVVGGVES